MLFLAILLLLNVSDIILLNESLLFSRNVNTQQILPKTSLVLRIDNTLLCIDYFSETALEIFKISQNRDDNLFYPAKIMKFVENVSNFGMNIRFANL